MWWKCLLGLDDTTPSCSRAVATARKHAEYLQTDGTAENIPLKVKSRQSADVEHFVKIQLIQTNSLDLGFQY